MRSEPPELPEPIELEDSDSDPMPLSVPKPLKEGGMLVGSAGRATGRVEGPEGAGEGLDASGDCGAEGALEAVAFRLPALDPLLDLERLPDFARELLDPEERFTAERLPSSFPALVEVGDRLVVFRFGPADLARGLVVARLASVFPARLAVMRFGAELDFLAVGRFAVDFLVEDFFFAGISPPSDGDVNSPGWLPADT